ncbi:thiamine pyrophosphate-binding protein [Tropicibacter oceani]|uniref:Thiamine pyrophosphate-binding protein n=1 Tax=Tropicibacter oceani TaxID=3058420 RepID=A0ABY8QMG6_9RHOB|nr:thiamine pyrophosphate-binding protein [Tropicibacter oceani]WGW05831.1 thiamine pyrophosphate-binding protein [Tropicibacter oceani]
MQKPLGAQISHMLKAREVEVIFGIPGVHNVEMYRGIEEAGITHILARHEQGAAFMADGYARATGRPGVCYLITGPGFVNAMTGLGQAYSDSVPVLALASCLDETSARRGQLHQMLDQRGAGATVCDWSHEARSAPAAYALIDRALSEFASRRPRPKAVHVPIDLLGALADAAPQGPVSVPRAQASQDALYAAIKAVLAARKPLFVFGGGALSAAGFIPDVLRQTGAAAFTTYAGRGLVPADHPLLFGSYLAREGSARIAAQADLVIAIGTELSEVDLWRDSLGHHCPMIRVDIDAEVLAQCGPRDMPIQAEAGAFLQAMSIAIPARTEDRAPCWDAAEVAATRAHWRAEIRAERPGIVEVTEALQAVMPDNAMIYSDMTQFAYGAKEVWDMPRPGHWHHPYGFGTLGYALPAAIGGAVARPGLPTCAILGDYGLQYTLPELGTAVELGLSLPILLWDNGKLGEIEDSMVRSQIAPNAVVARNPDFLAMARAYCAKAAEPATLSELRETLLRAFTAGCPTVIRMTPGMV